MHTQAAVPRVLVPRGSCSACDWCSTQPSRQHRQTAPAVMHDVMHSAPGITGVKVDCQAGVGLSGSTLGGGPAVSTEYHAALEDSVAAHFPGNACINCMCHSTENLYRRAPAQPDRWSPLPLPACDPCHIYRGNGPMHGLRVKEGCQQYMKLCFLTAVFSCMLHHCGPIAATSVLDLCFAGNRSLS